MNRRGFIAALAAYATPLRHAVGDFALEQIGRVIPVRPLSMAAMGRKPAVGSFFEVIVKEASRLALADARQTIVAQIAARGGRIEVTPPINPRLRAFIAAHQPFLTHSAGSSPEQRPIGAPDVHRDALPPAGALPDPGQPVPDVAPAASSIAASAVPGGPAAGPSKLSPDPEPTRSPQGGVTMPEIGAWQPEFPVPARARA